MFPCLFEAIYSNSAMNITILETEINTEYIHTKSRNYFFDDTPYLLCELCFKINPIWAHVNDLYKC